MTDLDKLNSIITKCRLFRQSTSATPNEIWLSDLIESLAVELRSHDRDHAMALTEAPPAPVVSSVHSASPKRGRWFG